MPVNSPDDIARTPEEIRAALGPQVMMDGERIPDHVLERYAQVRAEFLQKEQARIDYFRDRYGDSPRLAMRFEADGPLPFAGAGTTGPRQVFEFSAPSEVEFTYTRDGHPISREKFEAECQADNAARRARKVEAREREFNLDRRSRWRRMTRSELLAMSSEDWFDWTAQAAPEELDRAGMLPPSALKAQGLPRSIMFTTLAFGGLLILAFCHTVGIAAGPALACVVPVVWMMGEILFD